MSKAPGLQEPRREGFTLRIEGTNLHFEKRVGRLVASYVMSIALGLIRVPKIRIPIFLDGDFTEPPSVQCKDPELREFIIEHNAERNPDKILAIAVYYLGTREDDKDAITSGSRIAMGFKQAGFEKPSNFARDLRWTIANGWLKSIDKSDKSLTKLLVTEEGIKAVEEKFSDEVKARTPQPRGGEA